MEIGMSVVLNLSDPEPGPKSLPSTNKLLGGEGRVGAGGTVLESTKLRSPHTNVRTPIESTVARDSRRRLLKAKSPPDFK